MFTLDILTSICLMLLFALTLMLSLTYLLRSPFHFGYATVFLSSVFLLIPGWAWTMGQQELFGYAFGKFPLELLNRMDATVPFISLVVYTFCFLIGVVFGEKIAYSQREIGISRPQISNGYLRMKALYILLWAFTAALIYMKSGLSLFEFITPSRKDHDIYLSEYAKYVYIYFPLTLYFMNYLKTKRMTFVGSFWIAVSLLCALSTYQRRDFIIIFLFVVSTLVVIGRDSPLPGLRLRVATQMKLVCWGITGVALVPILWWARVWATSRFRGDTETVVPWEVRGFFEIIFGGQATGFPTTLLIVNHQKEEGTQWFYSFLQVVTTPIPRSIWEGKPVLSDIVIEEYYNLAINPSMFFINEVLFNFGPLTIPAVFVFGYAFGMLYKYLITTGSLTRKIVLCILFSNIVTLFKNGFSSFFVMCFFLAIIFLVPTNYLLRKNKIRLTGWEDQPK